jgi:hypothetical protein
MVRTALFERGARGAMLATMMRPSPSSFRPLTRLRRGGLLLGLLASSSLAAVQAGCGQTGTSGVSSSAGTTTSASSSTGSGGQGGATTSSTSVTTTGSGGQGGTTTSSTSVTTTGSGGEGGAGGGWPTCESKPVGTPERTLHQIWLDDPAQPTLLWVPGVFVTAISKAGCQAGVACQIFVQQAEQYAHLAAGSRQALKIFVSANTAAHFTGLAVGDKVDVLAWAWRYDVDGQHELLLQVNLQLPGCAKKVGVGVPKPVTVALSDLTLGAYEDTVGPLLVQVNQVSGKPQLPAETFGLWTTGVFSDAGVESIVSLSPYALSGGSFAFDPANQGKTHDFTSVTGVFGLFIPPGNPAMKFKEIYPRSMDEAPIALVH